MTKPPVPLIIVRVFALEYWEDEWLLCHRGHTERDWQQTAEPQYGVLLGYGDRPCLLRCCGTDRPRGKATSLVVTPLEGRDFVSVHDYLTTVHPWLMSFGGNILEYMGLWKGKPAEEDSVLMLDNFVGPLVVVGQTRGVRSWMECEVASHFQFDRCSWASRIRCGRVIRTTVLGNVSAMF